MGNQMEEEIWELEEAFYRNESDGNLERTYSMIHDQFLGWPEDPCPVVDKQGLIAFIKKGDSEMEYFDFKLVDKAGVRIVGNTAINHYKIDFAGKTNEGAEFRESLHVAHTWIKENSEWKLLSGMAYFVERMLLESN